MNVAHHLTWLHHTGWPLSTADPDWCQCPTDGFVVSLEGGWLQFHLQSWSCDLSSDHGTLNYLHWCHRISWDPSENPSLCWSDGSFRKLKGYCYNLRSIVRIWQSHVMLKRSTTVWQAVTQIQLSCIIHAVVRNVNRTATTVVFISDVTHTKLRSTPSASLPYRYGQIRSRTKSWNDYHVPDLIWLTRESSFPPENPWAFSLSGRPIEQLTTSPSCSDFHRKQPEEQQWSVTAPQRWTEKRPWWSSRASA